MIKRIWIAVFVLVSLMPSCKTPMQTTQEPIPVADTLHDYSCKRIMRDRQLFSAAVDMVPVDTAYVTKDTLNILTRKILGCEVSKFELLWNGILLKETPPKTTVKLFQQVDAACTERNYFHLTFDLKPIRFKEDSIVPGRDSATHKLTAIVNVGGWKNNLKYEFSR